jgi:hypothetical protein
MSMPDDRQLDYEAMKGLCTLAVRMRRVQIECDRGYSPSSYARKMALQEHFDQHAREILGAAGEVRQPAEVRQQRESKR